MLSAGQIVQLSIERPAAAGWMIARVDGQVVLVSGAIPGEHVSARIERVGKGVVYAETVSVETPSADRVETGQDPRCGGCLYAHVAYPRQLALKGQVIADAFGRIARLPLPAPPHVTGSPVEGYRMRARLHVRGRSTPAFFREGTHTPCDVRATRQLLPATIDALERLTPLILPRDENLAWEVEVSENVDAVQRAVHFEGDGHPLAARLKGQEVGGITGVTIRRRQDRAVEVVSGSPFIVDVLNLHDHAVTLRRHVLAFFQGNRYLLSTLVEHVIDRIEPDSAVVDLYAGVGVFSIAAAVARGARVIAIEGDRVAAADLDHNARAAGEGIETIHQSVEHFVARAHARPDTLIVDPPRTGLSHPATEGVLRLRARQVLYVSCDVATLARDAKRLVDAGYALREVEAFDLFPNTPHVETVVRFEDRR